MREYNRNAQHLKYADNAPISPAQILFRQTENKVDGCHRRPWPAGGFEHKPTPSLPAPFTVRFRLDHMHEVRPHDGQASRPTEAVPFSPRIRYNTTGINARPQNSNLRFEELKLGIVSRPEPLQSQRQDREKDAIHTISFRRAKPARRPENTWYTTTAIIKNPQSRALLRPTRSLGNWITEMCHFVCHFFEEHVQHVAAGAAELNQAKWLALR